MRLGVKTKQRLFEFRLRGVAEVAPWGCDGEMSLSWFGLTDGWFWLTVKDEELFRARKPREGSQYVNYQVVRLWEDLLDIVPRVLAPVPADVARRLERGWLTWYRSVRTWVADAEVDDEFDRRALSVTWLGERRLATGYLVGGPNVAFWRIDDVVHVAWDNRERMEDGQPIWSASVGHITMSVEDFIGEVRDFNDRLIAEMAERVKAARTNWPHPEVAIDLEQLDCEQKDRSTWLGKALDASSARPTEGWDAVRANIRQFETQTA
jgi:Family of unknown function (DUF5984)